MTDDINSLIQDWKSRVVTHITTSDDTDRLPEYALHLARILAYPSLDVSASLSQIDAMGQEVAQMLKKTANISPRPTQIIEKINDYLFNVQKFKPNTEDYYNPGNSYLNVVVERKRGIPITLCILYMKIASAVNFKMYPVNFPGHFLVKHILEDNSAEIIVDPFNSGRIMDDYSLKMLIDQAYPQQNIPLTHALVERATTAQVVIRMLNNLKGSYYESQDMDRYNIANEMVLAIDRYNPDAVRDRGIILLKKGDSSEALKVLNTYLEINPEADDADDILDIIHHIKSGKKE
ncbi:MAG: transglutaminase-like domain-containing protein [Thermoproteota archaeon]|nr:transglutaminase-like domain-containing protein [Thermoproteota archaeon]